MSSIASGTVPDTLLTDFDSVLQSSTARKLWYEVWWDVIVSCIFTWASTRHAPAAAETHLTFAATEEIASFLKFFFLDTAVPMLQWNHQCVKAAHSTRQICNGGKKCTMQTNHPLSGDTISSFLFSMIQTAAQGLCQMFRLLLVLGTRRPAEIHFVKFMSFGERSTATWRRVRC